MYRCQIFIQLLQRQHVTRLRSLLSLMFIEKPYVCADLHVHSFSRLFVWRRLQFVMRLTFGKHCFWWQRGLQHACQRARRLLAPSQGRPATLPGMWRLLMQRSLPPPQGQHRPRIRGRLASCTACHCLKTYNSSTLMFRQASSATFDD